MGEAYEFDGELFTNSGEFLDAVAHEYTHGDRDLALQTLEEYGFSVGDIHTGSGQPHPIHVDDNAHASTDNSQNDQSDASEEE